MPLRLVIVLFSLLSIYGCSKEIKKPQFIDFKILNDTVNVILKNNLKCPVYTKISNTKKRTSQIIQLNALQDSVVLRFDIKESDTLEILKNYTFNGYFGDYSTKTYDTNYNYVLPFKSGSKSKILQGYDGKFTHSGTSAKSLDFKMNIGDTINASRDGIVVATVTKHNKYGATEKYKDYANYVLISHEDNTFAVYVHLKQNGSLVNVGDLVKANDPIAIAGLTGLTTEPHLHFEVSQPTRNGLKSVPITFGSVPAKTFKKGIIVKKIKGD